MCSDRTAEFNWMLIVITSTITFVQPVKSSRRFSNSDAHLQGTEEDNMDYTNLKL